MTAAPQLALEGADGKHAQKPPNPLLRAVRDPPRETVRIVLHNAWPENRRRLQLRPRLAQVYLHRGFPADSILFGLGLARPGRSRALDKARASALPRHPSQASASP